MKRMKFASCWIGLALVFLIFPLIGQALAKDPPRMTKEELKGLMGKPGLIIIDVRAKGDWESSKEKIQGAVREDPNKSTKSWANKYPKDMTLVFYCA